MQVLFSIYVHSFSSYSTRPTTSHNRTLVAPQLHHYWTDFNSVCFIFIVQICSFNALLIFTILIPPYTHTLGVSSLLSFTIFAKLRFHTTYIYAHSCSRFLGSRESDRCGDDDEMWESHRVGWRECGNDSQGWKYWTGWLVRLCTVIVLSSKKDACGQEESLHCTSL